MRAADVKQRQATRETAGAMCKPPMHHVSSGETQGLEEKGLFVRLCSVRGTPLPIDRRAALPVQLLLSAFRRLF